MKLHILILCMSFMLCQQTTCMQQTQVNTHATDKFLLYKKRLMALWTKPSSQSKSRTVPKSHRSATATKKLLSRATTERASEENSPVLQSSMLIVIDAPTPKSKRIMKHYPLITPASIEINKATIDALVSNKAP